MAAAAILDFWNFKFLTVGTVKKVTSEIGRHNFQGHVGHGSIIDDDPWPINFSKSSLQ